MTRDCANDRIVVEPTVTFTFISHKQFLRKDMWIQLPGLTDKILRITVSSYRTSESEYDLCMAPLKVLTTLSLLEMNNNLPEVSSHIWLQENITYKEEFGCVYLWTDNTCHN